MIVNTDVANDNLKFKEWLLDSKSQTEDIMYIQTSTPIGVLKQPPILQRGNNRDIDIKFRGGIS